ncbi:MAG: PHP domain-containing protein [Oscillospiraceae bacterium]
MDAEQLRNAPFDQPTPENRLEALDERIALFRSGQLPWPDKTQYVNNHIHTIYSFSPYSPTGAAYTAWLNGLTTAGIMDHDSVAGGTEFVRAGEALGIATTVGFECRCRMDNTPFAGRRLNNPDQKSIAYVTCHGIPHQNIGAIQRWLAPFREKRNLRNRRMVDNINELLSGSAVVLDFDRDVSPLSQAAFGGSITERHILYALAFRITSALGKGKPVVEFLQSQFSLEVQGKSLAQLQDAESAGYEYTLLGVLKASLVEQFYIEATDECPDYTEFLALSKEMGAIPCYAYLGDVGNSVTGDKKTQKFEDDYLDELVPWLAKAGFLALTYMPTRNTPQQLARIINLCDSNGLFQISGEDINSPSQSFICKALDDPQFAHLITSTWALIGHEQAATLRQEDGMFSQRTAALMPNLQERVQHFSKYARKDFLCRD